MLMKMSLSRKTILFILPISVSLCVNPNDVRYKIGDSFFQLPLSDAQSMLSSSTEQIDTDVAKLEEKVSELHDELQQLKVALYARFGRSINLET